MQKLIRIVGTYLASSLVLGLMGLAQSYPLLPSTPLEWAALFLLALPVCLAAEMFGRVLWNNRIARFVDDATREQSFSPARIAYGVLAILLLAGLVFGAVYGWEIVRVWSGG
jgi:hypothetical protein